MKQYFLLLLPFFSCSMYAALQPEFFTFPLQQVRQDRFIYEDKHQQLKRAFSCPELNNLRRSVAANNPSSSTIPDLNNLKRSVAANNPSSSTIPDLNNLKRSVATNNPSSSTINVIYNGENKVSQGNIKIDNSVQVKGFEFKPQLNINFKVECAIL